MAVVLSRATQQAARYTPEGGRERCGFCRFYMSTGTCTRILGPVSPRGWCKYYSREMVQRWQPGQPGEGSYGTPLPSLDISFMTPGTLDPRFTFTRASTATYFSSTGTMQTAAINAARWDYNPSTLVLNGLLIEEARTNVLLNSATLVTESVTVTAQAYTLSFYGTGTITLSGASTAGPLVGTGAFPARVSLTFTPTAGTLTLTVTGSVLSAQLEAGAFATSYIATTAAAVTRSQDILLMAPASFVNTSNGTLSIELIPTQTSSGSIGGLAGSTGFSDSFYSGFEVGGWLQSNQIVAGSGVSSGNPPNTAVAGVVLKYVSNYGLRMMAVTNGGALPAPVVGNAGPYLYTTRLSIGSSPWAQDNPADGWYRRVRYWPRVLSDAEMQSVTT
jgi:hypothetical protein